MRRALVLFVALFGVIAGACPSSRPTAPSVSTSSSGSNASSSSTSSPTIASSGASSTASSMASLATTASVSPFASVPWRSLVAAEAWQPAAVALSALPESERGATSVRLARVRVAVGLCTKTSASEALDELPKLRADKATAKLEDVLGRLEVDALVCAERWKDALAITGKQALAARKGGPAARTLARVLEGSGDVEGARVALSKAIADTHAGLPTGALLALRLRLDRKVKDAASIEVDRKRLFIDFPRAFDLAVKNDGEPAAAPTLSEGEWLTRATSLAGLGLGDDALTAIDEAGKLGAPPRKVARAKGSALYKAHAYARAAIALADAAKLGGALSTADDDALDDAFHAARATSRAGDDDAAIVAYEALAKAQPKTHWCAEAAFLAANLRFLHGKWKDAVDAYGRYLAGPWPKEKSQEGNAREARRARAIALLEAGDAGAVKALDAVLSGKDYDKDSFARARVELLRAIALERAGDKPRAIAEYGRLRSAQPYGYLEVATRRRLALLGEPLPPWPSGPVPIPSPPPLGEVADLLFHAGLVRDARAALPKLEDVEARCAAFEAIDDGYDAYLAGMNVDGNKSPSTSGWTWRCAFPSPYEDVVRALEARERLPRGFMHAILRQESGFRVEVVSPAGAVGIAQLMPQTAATTATAIGQSLDETDLGALQAPFLQLDLASRHLHALYVELDAGGFDEAATTRATPLVIAAYNAGAGAVKKWLADVGTLDQEVFVEHIPFLETRGYTARVFGNLVRYAIMAGVSPPMLVAKFR